MTQHSEAVARYHKLLESEAFRDLAWVGELRQAMQDKGLVVSERPISPFLRPHLVGKRQYDHLTKDSEILFSAINRMKMAALSSPQLMARMELLPAEKMLATTDPGYAELTSMSTLEASAENGSMHFMNYQASAPYGVIYSEILSDLFLECAPMKEFRKKQKLAKVSGLKQFLTAMLKAWKEFGQKKKPQIGILEFKQPFPTAESNEHVLLAEHLRRAGYATEVVSTSSSSTRMGFCAKGNLRLILCCAG